MKSLLVVLAVLGFQAANAGALEPVLVKGIKQWGNLMPPIDADRKIKTELTVQVTSGGCTEAQDFKVEVQQKAKVQILKVVRLKQDMCEAYLPKGEEVVLNVSGLTAHKPVQVINPLLVEENFVY